MPASAKKLSATEIVALYDGRSFTFNNFTMEKPLVGITKYDFKKKTMVGAFDYDGGKDKGKFKGTIRMKGDSFCYKPDKSKETCVSVYTDGADVYETNAKKIVTSKNKPI